MSTLPIGTTWTEQVPTCTVNGTPVTRHIRVVGEHTVEGFRYYKLFIKSPGFGSVVSQPALFVEQRYKAQQLIEKNTSLGGGVIPCPGASHTTEKGDTTAE